MRGGVIKKCSRAVIADSGATVRMLAARLKIVRYMETASSLLMTTQNLSWRAAQSANVRHR